MADKSCKWLEITSHILQHPSLICCHYMNHPDPSGCLRRVLLSVPNVRTNYVLFFSSHATHTVYRRKSQRATGLFKCNLRALFFISAFDQIKIVTHFLHNTIGFNSSVSISGWTLLDILFLLFSVSLRIAVWCLPCLLYSTLKCHFVEMCFLNKSALHFLGEK